MISFQIYGENKNFTEKQKLRKFSSTSKPALQQTLRDFVRQETSEKVKTYNEKSKATKKIPRGTYMLKNDFKCKWINVPNKRHRQTKCIQKKTHIYAV